MVIELDQEAKGRNEQSIFAMRTDIHDETKIQAIQADYKYPKKTMFNRVHTVQESVDKYEKDHAGKTQSRMAEFQQFEQPANVVKENRSKSRSPNPSSKPATDETKHLMQ